MTEPRFTPGPWHYDSNISVIHGTPRYGTCEQTGIGGEFQGAETNALYEVCTVKGVRVYEFTMSGSGQHYPVKPEIEQHFRDQQKANANLIAAAPEMYEALKRVMENKWEPDKYLLNVLQAIAKAEGNND
jgi:hypothetical protein